MTPALRFALWKVEGHFLKKAVVNSAYRTPWHNAAVGGAENSYHTKCMAVDFFLPGVPKQKLIDYVATLNVIGGLGCYPGRDFIHMDVRQRPSGYRQPVTWGCT
ncbi:MAG: YcbK family protein [Hyphomicrobiaceae bacterium]|nr:YcbK family protein [Hyphomicrobiaceae bacterium]MCC0024513.1 YcbK family protein [Hyphomicrobiaceae bacterium]